MTAFQDLDPLLHQRLRLAVMSLLMVTEKAEFNFVLEKTGATGGNLSIQLRKLEEAKYITISKSFKGNYPLTELQKTETGAKAFEDYAKSLRAYIDPQ